MTNTVLDPVCGMRVEKHRAATFAEVEGRTYYFCSLSCARQFQAEPSRYVFPVASETRR